MTERFDRTGSHVPGDFEYDLALIFTAFQRNCVYVSIVKELAPEYRIAIVILGKDVLTRERNSHTNKLFLDLCASLGADVVRDQPISSRIEILAQSNYSPDDISRLNSMVIAERTFWLSGVAMGNAFYENLHGKRIDKILVPDRRLYNYRINNYSDDGVKFSEEMIEEIGVPYSSYPIFTETIDADYILAHPTPFSFVSEEDRLDYLNEVHNFARKVNARGEILVFKPHNADERADYIVDRRLVTIFSCLPVKLFNGLIGLISRTVGGFLPKGGLKDLFVKISSAIIYIKIMGLVTRLSQLTPYHNLNLELFLPDIRKGLITGRSNSIWHALFLKKMVWNCVDENKPYFDDEKMHKFMMAYLNVHSKRGCRDFERTRFDVISKTTRSADLIKFLGEELLSMH